MAADQLSTWTSVLPSVITAVVLLVVAFGGGWFTTWLSGRVEHRKWLRDARRKAYEGYAQRLWDQFNFVHEYADQSREEKRANALIRDRIYLVGSREMGVLVKAQEARLRDAAAESAPHSLAIKKCIEEFWEQARRDLGSDTPTN